MEDVLLLSVPVMVNYPMESNTMTTVFLGHSGTNTSVWYTVKTQPSGKRVGQGKRGKYIGLFKATNNIIYRDMPRYQNLIVE
jgi:hypothetical protein